MATDENSPLPVLKQRYKARQRITDLVPHPQNPRRHDDAQIDDSLDAHGFYGAVIVQEGSNTIIAGHGRVARAASKGHKTVPVLFVDVDDTEAHRIMLQDNRSNDNAGYFDELLVASLAGLDDLTGTGYNDDDLVAMVATLDERREPEPVPDEPVDAEPIDQVSNPGDVWQIGPHRLMVGDCRVAVDVDTLIDGATIHLGFTSPPYAEQREYDPTSGFRPIPPDEYVEWFHDVQANVAAHLADDGSWFVNIKAGAEGLDRLLYVCDLVVAHGKQWGWHFADEFVWERTGVPKQPVLRFKNGFEPIYQFAKNRWKFRPDNVRHATDAAIRPLGPGGGNTSWGDTQGTTGAINSASLHQGDPNCTWWADRTVEGLAYPNTRIPTHTGSHEAVGHTAAFPVGLPQFFANAYTDPDDNIYDPFVGSGSTIIAAHNTNRNSYGMELSPQYADIALRRIQRHTGLTPHRNGQPHTFHTPTE